MTLALLFPGQGVQHADMLPWLEAEPAAAPVLGGLAAQLGADWRHRGADGGWATRNRVAQPLVVGLALAAWAVLAPRLPAPAVVAGYSVGELAAYAAAGVFDRTAALALAGERAALMDASAAAVPGGLCAVSGPSVDAVRALITGHGLTVAICNAPDRCVIGGPRAALQAVAPLLVARGAELTPLRVGLASHTPAMAAAATAFGERIASLAWHRAQAVVVSGPEARGLRDPAALKQALAAQIAAPVDWMRALERVAERRPRAVLEVGPGTGLSRMWAARFADVPARSVDEFRHADAVVTWLTRHLT